jgi:hypothetical protein
MDILEKIIRENCWKFDKGYPDMDVPKDVDLLNEIVEGYKYKIKEEEDSPESEKAEIISLIQQGKFSIEQLKSLKSSIAGIEYKDDFFNYTKGKQMNQRAATSIYNKALELNVIQEVLSYIKSDKPNFTRLSKSGNVNSISNFKPLGSEFISWLYAFTIGAGENAVGVGRMEEFLIFMLEDTNNPGTGDVGLGDSGEIEVKGDNAKIWGQKKGLLSTSGFNRGEKSLDEHFAALIDGEVYKGVAGSKTAIAPILLQNVNAAQEDNASDTEVLTAVKNVLKDFYITSEGASKIDEYITMSSLSDANRLNTDIFKAQLNLYAQVEGWDYLWIGQPKNGDYKIFTADQLNAAIDSGDIIISSSMGLGNVYRMRVK